MSGRCVRSTTAAGNAVEFSRIADPAAGASATFTRMPWIVERDVASVDLVASRSCYCKTPVLLTVLGLGASLSYW